MEYLSKHRSISILFAIFFLLIIYGFFGSYFGQFPAFNLNITTITHFHAISITLWLIICTVQPLLIRYKKHQWHIRLGQFTYFYVPIMVLGMVLIIRQGYLNGVGHIPQEGLLAFEFIPVSNTLMFIVTYSLAVLNRKNRLVHRSYMVVNMVLLVWTAFGRLNYGWLGIKDMVGAVTASAVSASLLLLFMIIVDWFQGKINRIYVTWFLVMMLVTVYYYFGTTGIVWQSIAKFIFE
jgi:hypothetical protein